MLSKARTKVDLGSHILLRPYYSEHYTTYIQYVYVYVTACTYLYVLAYRTVCVHIQLKLRKLLALDSNSKCHLVTTEVQP